MGGNRGDLENQVMILTATGDYWFAMPDKEAFAEWIQFATRHTLRWVTKAIEIC